MQDGRGIKRIPLSRAANLPRQIAPAGYVVVIEDVEYGNRFKIVRMQEVNARLLGRAADLPFETELFLVLSAANAAALALELHGRFSASDGTSEWFDLDQAQVAQLRDFGRPQPPSLRDLALSQVEGQSLVEQSQIVSAARKTPPAQTRVAQQRPRRRWAAWLLLLAIVTLGASVVANAPQLRLLLGGRTSLQEMLVERSVVASATEAVAGADEVFYVRARTNARICASRECRAAIVLEPGARIVAHGYSSGQAVDGDKTWIVFRHRGENLYIHSSVLSQSGLEVNAFERPSVTPKSTIVPSATSAPTLTPRLTDTLTATYTAEPTARATQSRTPETVATATDVPAIFYIDTANNQNALIRACPRTDCEILGRLRPGAKIRPAGEVEGQAVNGITLWIEFEYEGQAAFVHGQLVAESP